jgi:hypothetical protein
MSALVAVERLVEQRGQSGANPVLLYGDGSRGSGTGRIIDMKAPLQTGQRATIHISPTPEFSREGGIPQRQEFCRRIERRNEQYDLFSSVEDECLIR